MRKITKKITRQENALFSRKLTEISLSPDVMEVISLTSMTYSIKSSCRHLLTDLKSLGASPEDRKEVESLVKKAVKKILIKRMDSISRWNSSAKLACLDFIAEYPLLLGFVRRWYDKS